MIIPNIWKKRFMFQTTNQMWLNDVEWYTAFQLHWDVTLGLRQIQPWHHSKMSQALAIQAGSRNNTLPCVFVYDVPTDRVCFQFPQFHPWLSMAVKFQQGKRHETSWNIMKHTNFHGALTPFGSFGHFENAWIPYRTCPFFLTEVPWWFALYLGESPWISTWNLNKGPWWGRCEVAMNIVRKYVCISTHIITYTYNIK